MVLTVEFTLSGTRFIDLNGGPHFRFTEAVSFQIACADQGEVDRLWSALSNGGTESQCGWLKDRWGLSWQVVPTRLLELFNDPNPDRASRATAAMLKMKKIIIADLEQAADSVGKGREGAAVVVNGAFKDLAPRFDPCLGSLGLMKPVMVLILDHSSCRRLAAGFQDVRQNAICGTCFVTASAVLTIRVMADCWLLIARWYIRPRAV